MTIGAVIQARMGSTRLPGKVMMELRGQPMLGHVLDRVRAVRAINTVLIATSKETRDDEIVAYCKQRQALCYRGSETDVLDRYYRAAALHGLTTVIRITADCPLLDPVVVQRVLTHFQTSKADYCSNVHPPTYPDGLDVEVMRIEALERAWAEAGDPLEREHVTPYIWRRPLPQDPEGFLMANTAGEQDHSRLRWTVDTAEDLERVRHLLTRQGTSMDHRKLL